MIKTFLPADVPTSQFHALMLSSIAPRPIAFVSTIDNDGTPNLAPFSFFNAFGSNPPLLIFSPARRVRNNTIKHTLENVEQVKEAVVNVVSYNMVQQASLASSEYEKGVNEFEKAGFTPIASLKVKPYRVKESPVQIECKVRDIIHTGTEGGAGNLVICEIVAIHAHAYLFNEKGHIDQQRIDLVGRMGGEWYIRASGEALFEIAKPSSPPGIGIDALPTFIRNSDILTGNDLGILGSFRTLPTHEEAMAYLSSPLYIEFLNDKAFTGLSLFKKAKTLIAEGKAHEALLLLIAHSQY